MRVQAPDGEIIQFPAGSSERAVVAYMTERYPRATIGDDMSEADTQAALEGLAGGRRRPVKTAPARRTIPGAGPRLPLLDEPSDPGARLARDRRGIGAMGRTRSMAAPTDLYPEEFGSGMAVPTLMDMVPESESAIEYLGGLLGGGTRSTGEERSRRAGRSALERMRDAGVMAGSAPVRMATRGEYGLGDLVGLVSPSGGSDLSSAERGFVENNPALLDAMLGMGEMAMGLPGAASMASMRAPASAGRPASAAARLAGEDVPAMAPGSATLSQGGVGMVERTARGGRSEMSTREALAELRRATKLSDERLAGAPRDLLGAEDALARKTPAAARDRLGSYSPPSVAAGGLSGGLAGLGVGSAAIAEGMEPLAALAGAGGLGAAFGTLVGGVRKAAAPRRTTVRRAVDDYDAARAAVERAKPPKQPRDPIADIDSELDDLEIEEVRLLERAESLPDGSLQFPDAGSRDRFVQVRTSRKVAEARRSQLLRAPRPRSETVEPTALGSGLVARETPSAPPPAPARTTALDALRGAETPTAPRPEPAVPPAFEPLRPLADLESGARDPRAAFERLTPPTRDVYGVTTDSSPEAFVSLLQNMDKTADVSRVIELLGTADSVTQGVVAELLTGQKVRGGPDALSSIAAHVARRLGGNTPAPAARLAPLDMRRRTALDALRGPDPGPDPFGTPRESGFAPERVPAGTALDLYDRGASPPVAPSLIDMTAPAPTNSVRLPTLADDGDALLARDAARRRTRADTRARQIADEDAMRPEAAELKRLRAEVGDRGLRTVRGPRGKFVNLQEVLKVLPEKPTSAQLDEFKLHYLRVANAWASDLERLGATPEQQGLLAKLRRLGIIE